MSQAAAPRIDPNRVSAPTFKAALNILDKWGCTSTQKYQILGMGRSAFFNAQKDPEHVRLSQDQLTRASYVLNIHAALRTVFENPENVYGFMAMPNNNPYFNGARPLEIIGKGHFGALHETAKRVDALRGGLW